MDPKVLELEFRLRKSEMDLVLANEKIAIYDVKIKDKNEIIETIKMSNNLYKSDYKEKIDIQTSTIGNLEEELSKIKKEKLKLHQEIEKLTKELQESMPNKKLRSTVFFLKESEKENKILIASLRAEIKDKTEKEKENDKCQTSFLKDQTNMKNEKEIENEVLIASLKAELAQKNIKDNENKSLIDQINTKNATEKENKDLIASLKNQIKQKNEKQEINKDLIGSLRAQIKKKDILNTEKEELITSLKSQIKEKEDHSYFLELGLNLETCKNKEKDDLITVQGATIQKLKSDLEKP
ncbi:hypothetical protein KR084_002700 [Drosophila pseudotakahashii]|nr:hypothetical protein KR084_002700 [Drosophila pseudotakahashii]